MGEIGVLKVCLQQVVKNVYVCLTVRERERQRERERERASSAWTYIWSGEGRRENVCGTMEHVRVDFRSDILCSSPGTKYA